MPVFCTLRRRWLSALLVLGAIAQSGCGDDAAVPARPDARAAGPDWSKPVVAEGTGSPDGSEGGGRGADDLLADLRSRIADGRGHQDASYQQSVENVATVLWDLSGPDPSRAQRSRLAAAAHQKVAAIAGDVSRWLAATPSARVQRTASNPTDLAIHDAFLAASAKGAEAYRRWCSGEAVQLLEAHREAVYRRLLPDRVPQPRVDGPGPAQGR